jgi:hypothetical protein
VLYRNRRTFNRQLGCAAYEVIWSIVGHAGRLYLVNRRLVWFSAARTLQRLLQQAGVEKWLEIWNHISPELAVSRYASRLQDRRPGHPGEEYLRLAQLAQRAEPMRLGPVFTVDQHKPLDMAPYPLDRSTMRN